MRLVVLIACLCLSALSAHAKDQIVVGSKAFTESIILGYVLADIALDAGFDASHRPNVGGNRVVFDAALSGDIDLYIDYTGTLTRETLVGQHLESDAEIPAALARFGLGLGPRLGFNNTYVLAMRRDAYPEITKTSDLKDHPDLRFGFSNEFMDRADGWPALRRVYDLPQTDVRGMEHELSYRAVASGAVDVMVAYSTDANIARFDLRLLEDDRNLFPQYDAVVVYRLDLEDRFPGFVDHLNVLTETINDEQMRDLNATVTLERKSEQQAAAAFVSQRLNLNSADIAQSGFWARLAENTLNHMVLVGISLSAAIILAIPLGLLAFRKPRLRQFVLGGVGILQTIPSLALFVFMIPLVGIGGPPAIIALFLYSLLPIVRNTFSGLMDIPQPLRESAEALGLPGGVILRRIELPLAARSILSGIKTAAVINVGTATLGALIGAGGYGQPILTGIRLADTGLILEGAIPAALLALATQGLFELLERAVVPKGLRLPRANAGA